MSTSSRPKPLRADAARNRERVLDAAHKCFAEHGVDAQMDDIAAAAGVGVGTVYRHFSTKEALLEGLTFDYFEAQCEVARRAAEAEDPWEGFTAYLREGAEIMASSRGLAEVVSDRPDVMQAAALAADTRHGLFAIIEGMIGRAQATGALRADFELEDIPMIMCSIGSLHATGKGGGWRRLLEVVIDGLRSPGSAELPPHGERLIPRST
ncbi:MAG TPA: helix-turn-helix domain-containing protein [Solirubrobacteraceae bacterium]|nr:helix-turn-helix domain-containing protein [Solirubrobacteraceae bacterium]